MVVFHSLSSCKVAFYDALLSSWCSKAAAHDVCELSVITFEEDEWILIFRAEEKFFYN